MNQKNRNTKQSTKAEQVRKDGVTRGKTVTAVTNRVQFKSAEHRLTDVGYELKKMCLHIHIYFHPSHKTTHEAFYVSVTSQNI